MKDRLKLGEVLLADGLISEFQLSAALGEQSRWGDRLGETLVHLGFLGEQELVRILSRRFQLPGVDLEDKAIAPEVLALVPREMAEKCGALPLFVQREHGLDVLYVGMEDPTDLHAIDEMSFRSGMQVRPVVAGPLQLRRALAEHYGHVGSTPALQRRRAGLVESRLPAEDTAPLLPEEVRPVLEPAPQVQEPAPEPAAPGTPRTAEAPAPVRASRSSGEEPAEAAGKPRQVPTRDILRALVHLLIERDVISREELLRAVQQLAAEDEGVASEKGKRTREEGASQR